MHYSTTHTGQSPASSGVVSGSVLQLDMVFAVKYVRIWFLEIADYIY
jgi:hypothetical protein